MIKENVLITLIAVFRKIIKNGRKNRDTKFVATEERKNYLMSDQTIIQQTASFWTCISHINKITHLFMNKPI